MSVSKQAVIRQTVLIAIGLSLVIVGACLFERLPTLSLYLVFAGPAIIGTAVATLLAERARHLWYPEIPAPSQSPTGRQDSTPALTRDVMEGMNTLSQAHPEDLRPYIDMIWVALLDLKDPHRAAAVYEDAMRKLKTAEDRETLKSMYETIRSRFIGTT